MREKRGLAYSVSQLVSAVGSITRAMFMGGTRPRADRAGETIELIEQEIRRMAESGPTEDELAKAKSYLKGSYALGFDTSTKIAGQLVQIQLDDLGIDYIDRRNGLIDAVTLDDVRRVAKRLLDGGLLVTVVGRPDRASTADSEHRRAFGSLLHQSAGCMAATMPLPTGSRFDRAARDAVAIDRRSARGRRRRPSPTALDAHRPRRARLAARAPRRRRRCRCCGCRPSATISPRSAAAPRGCATGATDIVFLGTGGSSLGGQTLAQLADYAVPGVGALARRRRACISWTISIPTTFGALLARLPLATTRFVAISKSGGTGETLMQTIAVLAALEEAGLGARLPELFLGLTEPAKAGKRNGLRDLLGRARRADAGSRPRRRRPLLGADQCRAAAGRRRSASTSRAIRAGAAAALAPVLDGKPPAEVPAAVGAALAVALAETTASRSR